MLSWGAGLAADDNRHSPEPIPESALTGSHTTRAANPAHHKAAPALPPMMRGPIKPKPHFRKRTPFQMPIEVENIAAFRVGSSSDVVSAVVE